MKSLELVSLLGLLLDDYKVVTHPAPSSDTSASSPSDTMVPEHVQMVTFNIQTNVPLFIKWDGTNCPMAGTASFGGSVDGKRFQLFQKQEYGGILKRNVGDTTNIHIEVVARKSYMTDGVASILLDTWSQPIAPSEALMFDYKRVIFRLHHKGDVFDKTLLAN